MPLWLRTEYCGGRLWDGIELGESEPFVLFDGARRTSDDVVSVELPDRRFRRRLRPRRWTEDEVEKLCRRLNAIDVLVIGTKETFCRVCGFDDHLDERDLVGDVMYSICPCCESESGLDDWEPRKCVRPGGHGSKVAGRGGTPEERPADWDPTAALAALPAKWRDL